MSGTITDLGNYLRPPENGKVRSGDQTVDPALAMGLPPNYGKGLLPHVVTFQGVLASVSRVYRASDEALKASYENARFMRNDPVIMECLKMRKRATALLNWTIEPDDETDPRQTDLADELTQMVERIPRFMQYRYALLEAIWYGRAANQHKWEWEFTPKGKRLTIKEWLPVHGDKIVFRYDDGTGEYDPNQVGIRVGAFYSVGNTVRGRPFVQNIANKVQPTDYGLAYFLEPWERNLLALHKHEIEDGEYEDAQNAGRIHGIGIRSVLYWVWYQKQELLAWLMEYLERSAFGIEIYWYPWGNEQARDAMRTAAEERIGQGRNVILVPRPLGDEGQSYGLERQETAMGGADVVLNIINDYFGHQIKRYILGQTLTTEAHATGLGSNLASIHLDTFMQIVKFDATDLEETLTTELIRPLMKANHDFRWALNIPFRFRINTEAPDAGEKLEQILKASQSGLRVKAADIYDIIGLSEPEETDEILQDPRLSQGALNGGMQAGNGQPPAAANGFSKPKEEEYAAVKQSIDTAGDARILERLLNVQRSQDSERMRVAEAKIVEGYQRQLDFAAAEQERYARARQDEAQTARAEREAERQERAKEREDFREIIKEQAQASHDSMATVLQGVTQAIAQQPQPIISPQGIQYVAEPPRVEIPAPVVNVEAPPTPVVNVAAPQVTVQPPNVTVQPPQVVVNIPPPVPMKRIVERDDKGDIVSIREEPA